MAAKKEMTFILQQKKTQSFKLKERKEKKTLLNTWGHNEQGGR